MVANNNSSKRVFVQPEDKPKLEKIASVKGWTYTMTLSRLIDNYIKNDPELSQIGQHLDVSA
jgi:hypothetical protein